MKYLLLTIALFLGTVLFAQEQKIPKNYLNIKHFKMLQNSEMLIDESKFNLSSKQIDTTGQFDASDTINYYIQNWKKYATKDLFFLVLPKGKILITKSIIIPSFVVLKGQGAGETTIICSVGENSNCIEIKPNNTMPIAKVPLALPAYKGDDTIYVANDILDTFGLKNSNTMFCALVKNNDSAYITSTWAKGSVKEHFWYKKQSLKNNLFSIPLSIADGNNQYAQDWQNMKTFPYQIGQFDEYIKYQKPLVLNYDTGVAGDFIEIYNNVIHAGVMCLSIERADTTVSQTSNIVLTNAAYCLIRGVESKGCNFAHISINNSFLNTIKRNLIHHGNGYGDGGKAYGVLLQNGASSNTVCDNVCYHLRHSFLLQSGANNNIIQANYSFDPFWEQSSFPSDAAGDIVLHGNYPFANLFELNVAQQIVIDDSHGKNGPFNIFHRNWLQNYGITMPTANGSDSQVFTGNEITNTGFLKGFYLLQDQGHFQYGNLVKGNIMPAGTNLVLDKMLIMDNYYGYYRRVASYQPPLLLDNDQLPFGEPFNQVKKTTWAYSRKDTLPPCFEYEFDNSFYSALKTLAEQTQPFAFPNPSSGNLQIKAVGFLEVYDLTGRLITQKQVTETDNLLHLNQKGMYILKLINKEIVNTQKVIISH